MFPTLSLARRPNRGAFRSAFREALRGALCAALFLLLSLPHAGHLRAQGSLKVNVPSSLVGLPQVGYEWPLAERRTAQVDLMVSPWRSVWGAPLVFGIAVGEWRQHFRERGNGPYVGLHVGVTAFHLSRPDYRDDGLYQEGFGALGGVTLGWQWPVRERWTMDLFVGGGTVQTKYKGYVIATGERYDNEAGWNESGEWIPYRAGIMLGIRR